MVFMTLFQPVISSAKIHIFSKLGSSFLKIEQIIFIASLHMKTQPCKNSPFKALSCPDRNDYRHKA